MTVAGDGAAVEFVVAGRELGRVDDQHLAGRTGEGELRTVTSLGLVDLSCKLIIVFLSSNCNLQLLPPGKDILGQKK